MAQTTLTLTKKEGGQTLRSETTVDLSQAERDELLDELKAHGSPSFGEFATIYVAPETYTLHVGEEAIDFKPQFFPVRYASILDDLMGRLA
ncbi:hypothetical protein DYU11_10035 [Fibrisoma montanum]|uniref:Uncharacterized protein n=1 Tax=Fibrisoma montanum TaxID=2305895 RepID=A0A418MAG1_9BACT|nr:hypothetical protein [Fibrisoma montanum]RIV23336.1 hypothetical protein DYU11_10035 [Fibrisoma montanum]